MKFRSWIVAGPPGSGKSFLIDKIHGWPGEVCLDITMKKWWAVEPLTHRPREIHLALPFKEHPERYAVYDDKWKGVDEFPKLDLNRIKIPSKKKFILAPNWRARFVFDFILPPSEWLLKMRSKRAACGDLREVDLGLTPGLVNWQVKVHWRIAKHFHQSGLQVMIRPFNTVRPYSFRVVEKIMRKKMRVKVPDRERTTITPDLDWSKLANVRHWVETRQP